MRRSGAQGNLKGQGMARRPMPCPFFNLSPVLTRTALVDLLANWEYRDRYRFPTRQTKSCLQPTSQVRLFVRHAQAGKRYLSLYSRYLGLGC